MKWCECEACRHDWLRRVVFDLTAVPPWGHDVLIRLAALEGTMATDFSGLEQAISDQKTVDDQILAKLDDLSTQIGQANSQGDQAQVAALTVELQQHVSDVRAALTKNEGGSHEAPAPTDSGAPSVPPAPAAGDGAVPAGSDPVVPASSDPSTTPVDTNPARGPVELAAAG